MSPYLSIVLSAANDGYDARFISRLQGLVYGISELAARGGLACEIVFVEWQLVADAPATLGSAIDWGSHLDVTIFTAGQAIARDRLSRSPSVALLEFIGRNAGIRRARGDYILCCDCDLLFSGELCQHLANRQLSNESYFRTARFDIHPLSASRPADFDAVQAECLRNVHRAQLLGAEREVTPAEFGALLQQGVLGLFGRDYAARGVLNLYEPGAPLEIPAPVLKQFPHLIFANGASEFLLLAKENWISLQGYLEAGVKDHLGALVCVKAVRAGLAQVAFPAQMCVFRQAPPQPAGQSGDYLETARELRGRENNPNWGLAEHELPARTIASRAPLAVQASRGRAPAVKRRLEISPGHPFPDYREWWALYRDRTKFRHLPDTEIYERGKLLLKINSLGCKGDELEEHKPVAAFFGDSTVFGVSMSLASWPREVKIKGYQSLNAGVEGLSMELTLMWYRDLCRKVLLDAAVVCCGWHNLVYGRNDPGYWRAILDQYRAGKHMLAICSTPTCLIPECGERGIEELLCSDAPRINVGNYFEYNLESLDKRYFNFWGCWPGSIENVRAVLAAVERCNAFLKNYCEQHGLLFIDLHQLLKPARYEDVPADFFDVCHLRPHAYPKVGRFVAEKLKERLGPAVRKKIFTACEPAAAAPVPSEDLRKTLYPVW